MSLSHAVLLASAGTGKTFRLSHRYLAVLAAGAPAERILATTFTRKAAGEILGRVLGRLAAAAADAAVLAQVNEHLGGEQLDRDGARALLGALVRHLDRVQVATLDAVFVRLLGLFALDLGLSPAWRLADESEGAELRDEALARLIESSEPEALALLIRELKQAEDGLTRGVHARLERLLADAGSWHRDAGPEAWRVALAPPEPDEAALAAAIEALEQLDLPTTAKGAPRSAWVKDRDRCVAAARAGDWSEFVAKGLPAKLLADEESYSGATIEEHVVEAFAPLLDAARHELLAGVERQGRTYCELLAAHGEHEQALKVARGLVTFDDLPRLLGAAPGLSHATTRHRLDGRIEHLLLDEFQDTSLSQWRVLEGLARGLTEVPASPTASLFCVGDVKQSIYSWRGGEAGLLAGLARALELGEPEPMGVNHRSAPLVLDLVNRIFGGLADSESAGASPELAAAVAQFTEGFPEHRAPPSRVDVGGRAVLWEVGDPDLAGVSSDERGEARCVEAAVRVAALRDRWPDASVGVLVRVKKLVPSLLEALRARGVPASGEGSNPLTDAEGVRLLLSWLHLADHPGDELAAFHLAHSPLAASAGLDGAGDGTASAAARRSCSLHTRAALARDGYGGWTAARVAELRAGGSLGARDLRRCEQLVDLAMAWDARADLRPSRFVEHVRRTSVEDSSAAAVRVMTVHASKGMEFDAVVLPDLDGDLVRRAHLLVGRDDPMQAPTELVVAPAESIRRLSPKLQELWHATQVRELREALAVLYVALTRARRSVDLLVDARPRSTSTAARLLRDVLAPGEPVADEYGRLFEHPDSLTIAALAAQQAPAAASAQVGDGQGASGEAAAAASGGGFDGPEPATDDAGAERVSESGPRDAGRRATPARPRAPSRAHAGGPSLDDLLRADDGSRVRGTVVHRWLAELTWLDEGLPGDESLLALARPLVRDPSVLPGWLSELRGWLEAPDLVALLTRPDDVHDLWREREFLSAGGALRGAIDRVHLLGADGVVQRAVVIDFKTDRSGDDAALVERHGEQLRLYGDAVAALTGLERSAVSMVVAAVSLGRALTIAG